MRTITTQNPLVREAVPPVAPTGRRPHTRRPLAMFKGAARDSHSRWPAGRIVSSSDDAHVRGSVIEIPPHVTSFMNVLPTTDSGHIGSGQILLRLDEQEYVADFKARARLWPRARLRSPYPKHSLGSKTRDLLVTLPRKHIVLVPATAAH